MRDYDEDYDFFWIKKPVNKTKDSKPTGVNGGIEYDDPPPERGWLDSLPKPAEEVYHPAYKQAMEDLRDIDSTQDEDYLPDRGKLKREGYEESGVYDPTDDLDW